MHILPPLLNYVVESIRCLQLTLRQSTRFSSEEGINGFRCGCQYRYGCCRETGWTAAENAKCSLNGAFRKGLLLEMQLSLQPYLGFAWLSVRE